MPDENSPSPNKEAAPEGVSISFSDSMSARQQGLVGQVIDGKYQILSILGTGGMGIVYKAEHALMNRIVAIKVLHSHLVEDEEFLKRFQHEARVASKLTHTNAVIIFDFGIWNRLPYIVMEFVEGRTLKQKLLEDGALKPEYLFTIIEQAGRALTEAHAIGIVHRDLKPDNIMISRREDGTEKIEVLDFGIAKLLHQTGDRSAVVKTQAGQFFGTPQYASPEQVLGKELDVRSDIYSLGIILYESLTGQVPFDSPSMMETLMKQLNQQPLPLRVTKPDLRIPQAVDDVVLKCLAKDPSGRYQSVAELTAALGAAVSGRALPKRPIRREQLLWVVMALVCCGLGVWYYTWQKGAKSYVEVVGSGGKKSEGEGLFGGQTEVTTTTLVVGKELVNNSAKESLDGSTTTTIVPSNGNTFFSGESSTTTLQSSTTTIENSFIQHQVSPTTETTVAVSVSPTTTLEVTTTTMPAIEQNLATTDTLATTTTVSAALNTVDNTIDNSTSSTVLEQTTTTTLAVDAAEKAHREMANKLYKEADKLYREKKYAEAIVKFEEVIRAAPDNKKAWISLGICYMRTGKTEEGFIRFRAALKLDATWPPTYFNLACYYALKGDKDKAFENLQKTIEYEPRARSWAENEPDLKSLKTDPRFKKIVAW